MPSVHTRHPTRLSARWGAASFHGPPPPLLPRRYVRSLLAGWPVVLFWPTAWLTLCTTGVGIVLILLVSGLVTGAGSGHLVGILLLLCVIWTQALLYYRLRQRERLGWPHAHGPAAVRVADPLGTELMVGIADLEHVLHSALGDADVVAAIPHDELTMVRMIATRAIAALRELRDQTVALGRAAAVTVSPDQERLAGARETVRLRLMRGMRDCTELAVIASTPDADDFRPRFAATAARLATLVADVNPLAR